MSERHPDPDAASTPADRELEAALLSLRPAAAALNPVDALFEAGRLAGSEHARWRLFAWRGVAAVMAVILAVMFVYRPKPEVIEHDRYIASSSSQTIDESPIATAPPSDSAVAVLAPDSMLTMRQVALERGVDHLPSMPGGHLRITHLRDLVIP